MNPKKILLTAFLGAVGGVVVCTLVLNVIDKDAPNAAFAAGVGGGVGGAVSSMAASVKKTE